MDKAKSKSKRQIEMDEDLKFAIFQENHKANKERNVKLNTTQEIEELIKEGLEQRKKERGQN